MVSALNGRLARGYAARALRAPLFSDVLIFSCRLSAVPCFRTSYAHVQFPGPHPKLAVDEGQWLKGRHHGTGKKDWGDGIFYEGEWVAGKISPGRYGH